MAGCTILNQKSNNEELLLFLHVPVQHIILLEDSPNFAPMRSSATGAQCTVPSSRMDSEERVRVLKKCRF